MTNIEAIKKLVTVLNKCCGLLHRRLQSCVGTQARLGYAAFDVQLRKAYFVTTLYAIVHLFKRKRAYAI